MGHNFIPVDRDQLYLLPPSIKDWLPEDHVAFFVLDVTEEMDLSGIYSDYRPDGWGAAAHEPAMMTALLVYAYCVGVRSSRQIERACHFDVAFRVIAANQTPDHTTISRFRARHEQALARVFNESLRLCASAGMTSVGVVALDGTKMATDASRGANRTKAYIDAEVEKILADAARIDAEEDARFGPDNRGDEPPAALRSREERRRRFAQAKARLDAEEATAKAEYEALLARRAATEAELGRKLRGRRPVPPKDPAEKRANTSDPESRLMKTRGGYLQGYNAQAVVNEDQVIVAAEATDQPADVTLLHPMVAEAQANLAEIGETDEIEVVLADAGYWSDKNMQAADPDGPELFVATNKDWRQRRAMRDQPATTGPPPDGASFREQMDHKLFTERGRDLYKKRQVIVEPVFGQIKEVRATRRFSRRGKAAADAEWKLICGTHNLLKLYRRGRAGEPRANIWRTTVNPATS